MKSIELKSSIITKRLAKIFVGDEVIEEGIGFPEYKGYELVNFFNDMGFDDEYGPGFQTRYKYSQERIEILIDNGRLDEFFEICLSPDEIFKRFDDPSLDVQSVQVKLVEAINKNILRNTDYKILIKGGDILVYEEIDLKPLGSGYFCDVYEYCEGQKKYAIKKLKDEHKGVIEYTHRFKREFEIMQELNDCEYTISVLDYVGFSFKMEYAKETLREFIERNRNNIEDKEKETICESIILGLRELHKREVIHRDFSYNNILMVDRYPKISDFGIGKDYSKLYSYKTINVNQIGTPHFTDPRQLENLENASYQTDIFSLGKMIDYIFCESLVSERHKYSSIVSRSITPNLENRYSSVDELYEAFISIKNFNEDFDPVDELIEMYVNNAISIEKTYEYLTRTDRNNILGELIIKNRSAAIEIMEIFSYQHEFEFESIINNDLYNIFEERAGEYGKWSRYDDFGYFCGKLILLLEGKGIVINKLIDIVNRCSEARFDINDFAKRIKANSNIPYTVRDKIIVQ
ncbi:protein kinase [Paraclostridium bifermentans]